MNLRTIDLNLLFTLQSLLEERHVTRASIRLNISQPAVSRALKRLRVIFKDPLLVRVSDGYDLTPRAELILPELNQLLKDIHTMVTGNTFEPDHSSQTLRLYGPDPDLHWIVPVLFNRVRQSAPNISVDIRSEPGDHFSLLESGEVHFVFSPFKPHAGTSQIRSMKLTTYEFVIVMSANHPKANTDWTIEDYLNASHGVVSLTGHGASFMEQDFLRQGLLKPGQHLHVPIVMSSFTSLAKICENSDVVFHLPKAFAMDLAKGYNLVVKDTLPEVRTDNLDMYVYWHEKYHHDGMCKWAREIIKSIIQERKLSAE